jgi:hypothetical protein
LESKVSSSDSNKGKRSLSKIYDEGKVSRKMNQAPRQAIIKIPIKIFGSQGFVPVLDGRISR